MKKVTKLVLLFLSIITVISSCQPDDETEPENTDPRDKYVGAWTCQEKSSISGNNPTFTVHINKSTTNSAQVLIENFYGLGFNNKAIAEVNDNLLTLNLQNIAGNSVTGEGSIQGNYSTILLNYRIDDGSAIDTITATLTKQ